MAGVMIGQCITSFRRFYVVGELGSDVAKGLKLIGIKDIKQPCEVAKKFLASTHGTEPSAGLHLHYDLSLIDLGSDALDKTSFFENFDLLCDGTTRDMKVGSDVLDSQALAGTEEQHQ
jgi:hypothetical protein